MSAGFLRLRPSHQPQRTEALRAMSSPKIPASGLSVAAFCKRYYVGADKVRAWIKNGTLLAINVAADLASKPQWRITPESVEAFEQRRSSEPTPQAPRRKRRQATVRDYYP
jgi:hypothetical protein